MMESILDHSIQLYMLAGIFILGMLTFISGVLILLIGVWGYDQRNLIVETSKLAQKGISEELSGLVGNASLLVSAINEMVKNRNGIGVLLVLAGAGLMVLAFYFSYTFGI